MATAEATITTLTAEVRVLMVGSRQVTLSVFRQLDYCQWDKLEPMGRVNDAKNDYELNVVGREKQEGTLVRSDFRMAWRWPNLSDPVATNSLRKLLFAILEGKQLPPVAYTEFKALVKRADITDFNQYRADWQAYNSLPLIVLAGLK